MDIIMAHGPQYDDPPKILTIVLKKTVFDEKICVNDTAS
jgi:hypothetical protein